MGGGVGGEFGWGVPVVGLGQDLWGVVRFEVDFFFESQQSAGVNV